MSLYVLHSFVRLLLMLQSAQTHFTQFMCRDAIFRPKYEVSRSSNIPGRFQTFPQIMLTIVKLAIWVPNTMVVNYNNCENSHLGCS